MAIETLKSGQYLKHYLKGTILYRLDYTADAREHYEWKLHPVFPKS